MKHIATSQSAALSVLLAVSATAAEAPVSTAQLRENATSIVSGTVIEVTAKTGKAKVDPGLFNRDRFFRVELKVAKTIKGDAAIPGETIVVAAWKAHRRPLWHAGSQGHGNIPKKGDTITVYVRGKDGKTYIPIRPNGITIDK